MAVPTSSADGICQTVALPPEVLELAQMASSNTGPCLERGLNCTRPAVSLQALPVTEDVRPDSGPRVSSIYGHEQVKSRNISNGEA